MSERVGFTGIRDLAPQSIVEIKRAVRAVLGEEPPPIELIFGGARGSDTLALLAASVFRSSETRLVVIVPFDVRAQPVEAREAIECCADEVVELRWPRRISSPHSRQAYHARNDAIIERATRIVAFWDGSPGGTAYTIGEARRCGVPVEVVRVERAQ